MCIILKVLSVLTILNYAFQVSVDVGSVSNLKPVFQSANYEATVSENATSGTFVLQVAANDPDGDDNNLK